MLNGRPWPRKQYFRDLAECPSYILKITHNTETRADPNKTWHSCTGIGN